MKNLKVSIMSKTKISISILLMALTIVSFTACEDYPEGPAISLLSKTDRVANNWKVAQALNDSADVTSDYNRYELDLSKTGNAELTAKYSFLSINFDFTTTGTWSFLNDSKKIAFNFENDNADGIYVITKLMEDEMWLKKEGESLELHYVTR